MICLYHIIKDGVRYKELGMDYLDKKTKAAKLARLRNQAHSLVFSLIPVAGA